MKFFHFINNLLILQIYSFLTCFIILKLDPVNIFTLPGGTMISLSEGYCRNAVRGRDIDDSSVFCSKACTLQLSAGSLPSHWEAYLSASSYFPVVHPCKSHQCSISFPLNLPPQPQVSAHHPWPAAPHQAFIPPIGQQLNLSS